MAPLELAQEIDDLRLHRHVERRGRLIEDEEFRLEHDGPGDGDALALAAGEFVRIAVCGRGIEARPPSAPLTRAARSLGRASGFWMSKPFLDDLPDRKAGRQRAIRVLEHDLHMAPERPHAL